jgi:hypothetical protein
MFFFRKQKFFLELSEPDQGQDQAAKGGDTKVILAPPAPAKDTATKAPASAPAPAPAIPVATPSAAPAATPAAPVRTTAEDIAAQLAAEAASRPAPTFSTFAPECVVPGGATPRQRRKAGANLGAFKAMAKGMMKS